MVGGDLLSGGPICLEARDLGLKPSCQRKLNHAHVASERPPRVGECRRHVLFEDKVADPGNPVSDADGAERPQRLPIAKAHGGNPEAKERSENVRRAGLVAGMRLKIMRPKLFERGGRGHIGLLQALLSYAG